MVQTPYYSDAAGQELHGASVRVVHDGETGALVLLSFWRKQKRCWPFLASDAVLTVQERSSEMWTPWNAAHPLHREIVVAPLSQAADFAPVVWLIAAVDETHHGRVI